LFIFFWQNVNSAKLFIKHLVQLPLRILLDISRGRFAILKAFMGALVKIPLIVWHRLRSYRPTQHSDAEAMPLIDYWFFYRYRHLLNGHAIDSNRKLLLLYNRLPKT